MQIEILYLQEEKSFGTGLSYGPEYEFESKYKRQKVNVNAAVSAESNCVDNNVWFVWDNQSQSCHCGSDLNGIVHCDTATVGFSVLLPHSRQHTRNNVPCSWKLCY